MNYCPHCGHNLEPDKIEERDGFSISPDGEVRYQGRFLNLRRQPALLMHTIAAAGNRTVAKDVIVARVTGHDVQHTYKFVDVLLSRLRFELKRLGVPVPIETVWGQGLRWKRP